MSENGKSAASAEPEKKKHYISAKESRKIAKDNRKAVKELQKKRASYKRADYLTEMRDPANIVEFDDLHTYFFTDNGVVKAVDGVSFDIPQGATVGVVGESGCGKSVTSLSLMQLVQGPAGQIVSGSIRFRSTARKAVGTEPVTEPKLDEAGDPVLDEAGNPVLVPVTGKFGKPLKKKIYEEHEEVYDIAKMPVKDMTAIRGREIAMIFQEPMTSLNPVFTIGYQLDEVTLLHMNGADKATAKKRSIEMLELVGIAMAERVYKSYPHELSGGMRQRVMIAMALCCNPKLIIADEPTTALDVTIQAQILDLLRSVKQKMSGSIMLITHDLGVIAEMVDYVVVMYAGRVVEKGTVREIFKNPLHPYTIGLQKSKPVVRKKVDRLYSIPGNVPNPVNMPSYCYFRGRCNRRCEKCAGEYPPMIQVSDTHFVSCWRAEEILREREERAEAEKRAEEARLAEEARKEAAARIAEEAKKATAARVAAAEAEAARIAADAERERAEREAAESRPNGGSPKKSAQKGAAEKKEQKSAGTAGKTGARKRTEVKR